MVILHAPEMDAERDLLKNGMVTASREKMHEKDTFLFCCFSLYHKALRFAMHEFLSFCITLYITKRTTKICRSVTHFLPKALVPGKGVAVCMARFKLPKMPSTVNKTIRFPQDIVDQVEVELRGANCNFSQFVIQAVRVALQNLEEDREAEQNQKEAERPDDDGKQE